MGAVGCPAEPSPPPNPAPCPAPSAAGVWLPQKWQRDTMGTALLPGVNYEPLMAQVGAGRAPRGGWRRVQGVCCEVVRGGQDAAAGQLGGVGCPPVGGQSRAPAAAARHMHLRLPQGSPPPAQYNACPAHQSNTRSSTPQTHIKYEPFVDTGYPLFAAFAKAWLKAGYPVIVPACEPPRLPAARSAASAACDLALAGRAWPGLAWRAAAWR